MSITSVKDIGLVLDMNSKYRKTMEDGYCVLDSFRGRPKEALFAVFDGHFGRAIVDIIERTFQVELANALDKSGELTPNKIQEAIAAAYAETDLKTNGVEGGSTCVSCLILSDSINSRVLYTANCGDSRGVLYMDDTVHVLTYDHKGTDPNEVNRVIDAGGRIKRGRVNTQLAVTRAFGNHKWKQYVISEPFQTRSVLNSSFSFLILASDGLWDVIGNQEAIDFCKEKLQAQRLTAQECAQGLTDLAKEKKSNDNITVMVVVL
jgi:protein phosphatase PTC1